MPSGKTSENLEALSDEELVEKFRETKSEVGGKDPAFAPPNGDDDPVRAELLRRGLAPDREDVIPDNESPSESPVEDDA